MYYLCMIDNLMHKPLPAQTQVVADVIGRDRALHLVRHWKRTRSSSAKRPERLCVYIPATLPIDHELVRVMGWSDATKLVAAFRGEILELAMCDDIHRDWRNQAIRRLACDAKMKAPELSEWFEISERQVRNVLREIPTEARAH
ncbi:MAG TPA: hypothetical protein VGV14_02910 [Rhodanobacter sp.]|nr:hypothetical protein [Rhodanobacter sp.]